MFGNKSAMTCNGIQNFGSAWMNWWVSWIIVVAFDGSNKFESIYSRWMSLGANPSINQDVPTFGEVFSSIVRIEGYEAQGVGRNFSKGSLRSFDLNASTEIAVLGSLPEDILDLNCFLVGPANAGNIQCFGNNNTENADAFFLNTVTPNSLARITNTPTISEFPFYW